MDNLFSDSTEDQSLRPSTFPRPCSSIYDDNFALEDLAYQVDESVRVAQLNTVEQLLSENSILRRDVARHRRVWNALLGLFDEAFDMALLLRGSLEGCKDKIAIAEANWLGSWGVGKAAEVDNWI